MAKRRQQHALTFKHHQAVSVTITIDDLSRSGAGIGRDSEGRAIFVPFTAPGDVVKVKLHKQKRRYAEGELTELVTPSPVREVPRCPVFMRCGGCQWQHIPYELQWQTKEEGVRESLRLARVESPSDWIGFPARYVWEYRNRIQLRGRDTLIGYYARQSNTLVPVEHCDIAKTAINTELKAVAEEGRHLKHPYKVELYLDRDGNVQRVWNDRHGAAGFRQVNDEQNVNLQDWIKSVITPVDGLLDLFGGSGNLSLPLLDLAKEIHCVDTGCPDPHQAPVRQNLIFHRSPVFPWLQKRLAEVRQKKLSVADQFWAALIDPPRGGLGEDARQVIQALGEHNVQSVVLVGCKSDPWSRDIASFLDMGWSLKKVAVFDFFPQTSHVESAALLIR